MYTQELSQRWWLVALRGALGILVGLVLLASPIKSLVMVTFAVGVYALMEGLVQTIYAMVKHKELQHSMATLIQGVLGMLLGILLLNWPKLSLGIMVFLVGLWLLILGILFLAQALQVRKEIDGGEWYLIAGAVVAFAFGLLMLGNLVTTAALAGLIIGLSLVLKGIFSLAFGFQLKRDQKKLAKLGY